MGGTIDMALDGIQLFVRQHAQVHSAAVSGGQDGSLADMVLRGLSDEQMRLRPRGELNSLAWLFWHMARAEDVGINVVLAGEQQVLDRDHWPKRLKIARRDIGTSMTSDEVSRLSEDIDPAALREYRDAVGRKTRDVARRLPPDHWDDLIDASTLGRVVSEGAFAEGARWVEPLWARRPRSWFLTWVAAGHSFAHLGEAICVRSQAAIGVAYWNTGDVS
jgi:hypothetical protein